MTENNIKCYICGNYTNRDNGSHISDEAGQSEFICFICQEKHNITSKD